MSYHGLLEYIRSAKDCGANDREIAERLHKAGWYRVDIQDGFELYRTIVQPPQSKVCEPVPMPSMVERLVPHTYDPQVIAVAAFSFGLGFLGYLFLMMR